MSSTTHEEATARIASTLRGDCGACNGCISLLCPSAAVNKVSEASPTNRDEVANGHESATGSIPPCRICLGILSSSTECLMDPILDSSKPYGGLGTAGGNVTTKESPTVSLPAVLMVRAYCALCAVECDLRDAADTDKQLVKSLLRSETEYYDAAKELVRARARRGLARARQRDGDEVDGKAAAIQLSLAMRKEEAGHLGVHLLLVPNPPNGEDLLPPSSALPVNFERKRERKRFRGNDPTNKQGGDPKENLMKRIRARMGGTDGIWNLDRNAVQRTLDEAARGGAGGGEMHARRDALGGWIKGTAAGPSSFTYNVHAAVWRRPFYVGGRYTKSRRDVSQTPFYVPDGPGGGMIKKGITSVEEEICPALALVGCGGISKNNNEEDSEVKGAPTQNAGGGGRDPPGKVVYGMCKFHASGREDLDVRMLLPAVPDVVDGAEKGKTGGRPFVCEVIDAHRMPVIEDFSRAVSAINCTDGGGTNGRDGDDDDDAGAGEVSDIVADADLNMADVPQKTQTAVVRQYGRNPRGVGVSSLAYFPSSAFKNLQSETENKVKHYGCVCWSARALLSQEQLDIDLGATTGWKGADSGVRYPLEIRQSTPLRVLHRRAAAVRVHHILTLTARRIDEHWFALHLSTSAGTYVKEFVHGDCGRTVPSVSSMLGGKTDIIRLDCEGIAI